MMTQATPRTMDGYIRVSRVQGREGPGYQSPKIQRDAIERWAQYKGVTIAEWHVDEDESGGTQERPGLLAAINRAVNGETGGIVSWKIDRFSRFTEGGLRDLRQLEAEDARLAFVVEDIDTTGPMGKFVYTVMLAMGEYFLDTIKAGWKTSKANAIGRGVHVGPTPFGYARVKSEPLTIDPNTGPVVTEAFAIAAREGLHAVVDYLVEHAPARTWTAFTVRRFMKQRVYLGQATCGDGVINESAHPALVTRGIFEAANHAIGQIAVARRSPKGEYPLSGIATCDYCGSRMVGGHGGNDNRRIYRCGKRCAEPALMSADPLEAHVVAVLRDAFDHPGFRVGADSPDTAAAVAAVEEAELELDRFASDLEVRSLLGHRYAKHLQQRVEAVRTAEAELARVLAMAQQARLVVPAELWDDLEPAELAEVLSAALDTVTVTKGRGPVAGRVRVVPKGLDGAALAGAQDA